MGVVRDLREYQREAAEARSHWPPECWASERKYGRRVARLYPLIGRQNAVRTPLGPGTLLQAFEDRPGQPGAMVLHLRPRSWIWEKGRKRPAADFVGVEDVEPYRKAGR